MYADPRWKNLFGGVFLDHGINFALHFREIEGGRILHRRVVDGTFPEFCHIVLDFNEAPELSG